MNEIFTSLICNFWYSIVQNPILDWKESTRLTYCWVTHENPQVPQVLKSSEVSCSEYWRKVDVAAGKPLCKFTLITANTNVGVLIGPKSQKGVLHVVCWHSRDSAAEPLTWVRAWEGCQKLHWKVNNIWNNPTYRGQKYTPGAYSAPPPAVRLRFCAHIWKTNAHGVIHAS